MFANSLFQQVPQPQEVPATTWEISIPWWVVVAVIIIIIWQWSAVKNVISLLFNTVGASIRLLLSIAIPALLIALVLIFLGIISTPTLPRVTFTLLPEVLEQAGQTLNQDTPVVFTFPSTEKSTTTTTVLIEPAISRDEIWGQIDPIKIEQELARIIASPDMSGQAVITGTYPITITTSGYSTTLRTQQLTVTSTADEIFTQAALDVTAVANRVATARSIDTTDYQAVRAHLETVALYSLVAVRNGIISTQPALLNHTRQLLDNALVRVINVEARCKEISVVPITSELEWATTRARAQTCSMLLRSEIAAEEGKSPENQDESSIAQSRGKAMQFENWLVQLQDDWNTYHRESLLPTSQSFDSGTPLD